MANLAVNRTANAIPIAAGPQARIFVSYFVEGLELVAVADSLPWDCAVAGVPASLQGSSRKRADWRDRVSAAARLRWPSYKLPLLQPLALTVAFLHTGEPSDVDNMLKPTVDGLTRIAYADDRQIDQIVGLRYDLARGLRVSALSPVLAAALVPALAHGRPFVYIRLTPPRDFEELLQ